MLLTAATALDAQNRRGRNRSQGSRYQGDPFQDNRFQNRRLPPDDNWSVPHETPKQQSQLPIYLPGFEAPGKGGKGPAPVGPKPKSKPPPKAAVPGKPDPMTEADQITAAADHRSAVEAAQAQLLGEHFRLCDLDASGWLSLREAQVTLSLDRGEFRRMDANQDGRLAPAEFTAQGEELLARLGARPASPGPKQPAASEPPSEPRADAPAERAPEGPAPDEPAVSAAPASAFGAMPVRPHDLLARYDVDRTGGLDASETGKLFLEAGLALSSDMVVAQMDPDDTGQLEASELVAIAWMVSRHVPDALRPPPEAAPYVEPPSDELTPAPRKSSELATHFGLLDANADGFIDEADLRSLLSPARLDVRLRALLSAMDQDGDGRLTEAEFQASMGAGPR